MLAMLENFKNSGYSDVILVDVFRPYFISNVNLSHHKIDKANSLPFFSHSVFPSMYTITEH